MVSALIEQWLFLSGWLIKTASDNKSCIINILKGQCKSNKRDCLSSTCTQCLIQLWQRQDPWLPALIQNWTTLRVLHPRRSFRVRPWDLCQGEDPQKALLRALLKLGHFPSLIYLYFWYKSILLETSSHSKDLIEEKVDRWPAWDQVEPSFSEGRQKMDIFNFG